MHDYERAIQAKRCALKCLGDFRRSGVDEQRLGNIYQTNLLSFFLDNNLTAQNAPEVAH